MTDTPDAVEVRFTKWGGAEHWHVPARRLGDDEHGTWLHVAPGARTWRPGAQFRHRRASVLCIPRGRWWVATFYDAVTLGRIQTYVDVATPAVWDESDDALTVVHAVDLDLDVVRPLGGEPFTDDEDEFTEHSVSLGYPPEVVEAARSAADTLLAAVAAASAPFDAGTARRWLEAGAT